MGLSSKQVISSNGLDWSQTLLEELPKPPILRRQTQQNQQNNSSSSSFTEPLKCPRCDSTNTKFCYYNNYNKSQPRHFCKTCKRHWTKGGTLRNVPVGGGRKNKRLKTSKSAAKSSAATTTTSTSNGNIINRVNPHMVIQAQQLKQNLPLAFGDQKVFCPTSSVLQQDSISCSNNGVFLSSALSLPQDHGLQFPYSSSSCFGTNPSSISTSFQSSILYNNYTGGEQAVEDSTVTTVIPATGSSSTTHNQLWQVPNASYWNWEDIDNFVPTDLNMPWDDDSELKP
ncbi:hypothetical protein JCGZ_21405 [Jatropha curcas]|uniref:Dof zinc finger protein n=1 Tax=Jatropha curcas TaxID=180498 RepID=A0A067JN36_JATCU|nr:hypothetical protein JCGZ_21405 [Jatropha curcas]